MLIATDKKDKADIRARQGSCSEQCDATQKTPAHGSKQEGEGGRGTILPVPGMSNRGPGLEI